MLEVGQEQEVLTKENSLSSTQERKHWFIWLKISWLSAGNLFQRFYSREGEKMNGWEDSYTGYKEIETEEADKREHIDKQWLTNGERRWIIETVTQTDSLINK